MQRKNEIAMLKRAANERKIRDESAKKVTGVVICG